MAYQKPQKRTISITGFLRRDSAPRGGPFLECESDQGVVAFWGEGNISRVESNTPPFRVTCGCITPNKPWSRRHDLWVPEKQQLEITQARPSHPNPAGFGGG